MCNFSKLPEIIRCRVTVVTQVPNMPHTMTGFLMVSQTGWHETQRKPNAIVFFWPCSPDQTGIFLKDNTITSETFYIQQQDVQRTVLQLYQYFIMTLLNHQQWIIRLSLQSLHIPINGFTSCMNAAGCWFTSWFIPPGKRHLVHVTGGEKEDACVL